MIRLTLYAPLAALFSMAFGLGVAAVPLDEGNIEEVGAIAVLALLVMIGFLVAWSGATRSLIRAAVAGLLLLEAVALFVALGIGVQQGVAGELDWYEVPIVPVLFMTAYFAWWAAVPGAAIGLIVWFFARVNARIGNPAA